VTSEGDFRLVIQEVVKRVKPAVVQVNNEQRVLSPFGIQLQPQGVGSGFIFDDQGHVLTNNHVIEGAQRITVSLPDGRTFEAQLVGRDSRTDLAVLRITGSNLPRMELGSSQNLAVGQWVIAIGNALGLPGGPTVTVGVVSAVGRTVQNPRGSSFFFDLIQTDAAINPGNSGGPLVDLEGRVIGINTLAAGQIEPGFQAQGIGFAIAIDTAKPLAEQIIASGRVRHAYLGVNLAWNTPGLSFQYNLPRSRGYVVAALAEGGPADKAGLRPRDVITRADGQDLEDESTLYRVLYKKAPGDKLELTVQRGTAARAETLTVTVTLGELPSAE